MTQLQRTCADCGRPFAIGAKFHMAPGFEPPTEEQVELMFARQGEWVCGACEKKRQPVPELDDYEYALRNARG